MPEDGEVFAHLFVRERAESEEFRRSGGGNAKIRDVEQRAHGRSRLNEIREVLDDREERRAEQPLTDEELRSLGVIVVLEGSDEPGFRLKLDSLQQMSGHRKVPARPKWLLLSVRPATDGLPERATVWISDEYRAAFVDLFASFAEQTNKWGNPPNQELVANIARIRSAVLDDLWQSAGEPSRQSRQWWEIWLHPTEDAVDHLRRFAGTTLRLSERVLKLHDRTVTWVEAKWSELEPLPFTRVPVAEIRKPEFVDTVEDLSDQDQSDLMGDLVDRVTSHAGPSAPAVCHLDTGIRRTHALLAGSLADTDIHSIVDEFGSDQHGHGTLMAGLSLYGPLDSALLGTAPVALGHRLESVKILPDNGPGHDPLTYGVATAQAAALPEAVVDRSRVFAMPVTAVADRPGEPTLWSASVDALAAGVDISRSEDGLELLGVPDPNAARLFVISAGNVRVHDAGVAYRDACDLAAAEDPAQAWNALTVGAYSELNSIPTDPSFDGWAALGLVGDISPHSRTSLLFGDRSWPIKPDICMEGGNVLTDGVKDFVTDHPLLSLRTTDAKHDLAIGSANATSAATAQAARLAALALVRYPSYWPETVRGLLVHGAEWTPTMRGELDGKASKTEKLRLLRRYGWGAPSESTILDSSRQAVTTVTQDSFRPFDTEHRARQFRLHRLPWPVDALRDIATADVELRITLSYFIEPTASRRGWRQRYVYPSHGLRFELKLPTETTDEFIRRVNQEAEREEDGTARSTSSGADRWLVGSNQRNLGSLHQDIWEGSGAELAESGAVAIYPVGGWWKNNKRKDRANLPVRYALLVSLRTAEATADLYTPIAAQIGVPVQTAVPAS